MIHCFKQTLPEMKKQVKKLEDKYKDIAQLKTMKEQVEELKKERVWAEVIELEKVLITMGMNRHCMTALLYDDSILALIVHTHCVCVQIT